MEMGFSFSMDNPKINECKNNSSSKATAKIL